MRSPAAIEFHALRLEKGLTERTRRCIPSRAGANHSTCISYYTVLMVKTVRSAGVARRIEALSRRRIYIYSPGAKPYLLFAPEF